MLVEVDIVEVSNQTIRCTEIVYIQQTFWEILMLVFLPVFFYVVGYL